jgi:hypothetical protein
MNISTIKFLESLAGYDKSFDQAIDDATLYGIGHARNDKKYTPCIAEIDKCLGWLDRSDEQVDPFSSTVELFGAGATAAEQHADKVKRNHGARLLLEKRRREILFGGKK